MNLLKLLVLLKSNLKLKTYKRETAKQKIINSRAEFPMKIYHSVSRNSVLKSASPQKSAKIILKPAKSTYKNLIRQKRPKKGKFHLAFFQKKNPKELKKGQKLQIWPQKSQTGNPERSALEVGCQTEGHAVSNAFFGFSHMFIYPR